MLPSQLIGIFAALTSAFVWGSGDFAGGLAARRSTQFHVVMLSALSGLILFVLTAILRREPLPSPVNIAWSCAAGLSGAIGIAALYRGLSTGSAAVVAPTSGVVAAIIPVVVGSILEGLPSGAQLIGIPLGLAGIYLVSRPHSTSGSTRETSLASGKVAYGWGEIPLALFAGAGFGGFFVLIAQVESDHLFAPLAFAKLAAFAFGLLFLIAQRRSGPPLSLNPLALLAGVLDAGGNLFYLIAVRYIALAVAGVLSSMYPAATVILAMVVLNERIMRFQAVGVLLCLAAVAMIAI